MHKTGNATKRRKLRSLAMLTSAIKHPKPLSCTLRSSRSKTFRLLAVTPFSLSSTLGSPIPSPGSRRLQGRIPFVVAVDRQYLERDYYDAEDDDIGGQLPNGHFNVALETLLQELFPLVGDQSRSPGEIGRHVGGGDVWCSGDRFGVHKDEGYQLEASEN